MFEFEQKPTTSDSSLSKDLIQLYDEFAELNDYHAFFCDAFAGVVANDEVLDTSTIHGINRCSCWIKYRMEEFKEKLMALQKKSCTTEAG